VQVGQNLTLREGNGRTLVVDVLDAGGRIVDLTGCYLRWEMGVPGRPPLVSKTSDDPAEIHIPNRESGQARIYLRPSDVTVPAHLGARQIAYNHELLLTTPDGSVETVLTGRITITRRFS
jgi:hypothetical protein